MHIRPANAADADAISRLADEFHDYLHRLGDNTEFIFTEATYLRDGFGEKPGFYGLVAESDDTEVIGYLLFELGYDTDRSRRVTFIHDLYVQEKHGEATAWAEASWQPRPILHAHRESNFSGGASMNGMQPLSDSTKALEQGT